MPTECRRGTDYSANGMLEEQFILVTEEELKFLFSDSGFEMPNMFKILARAITLTRLT